MIVYQKTTQPRERSSLMVTPSYNSDSVEFRHQDGSPRTFEIVFRYGRAEVDNNLGRWLVDNGYATTIFVPGQRILNAFRSASA